MMRRVSCLLLALAAGACAAKGPAAPRSATTIPAPPPRGEPSQYIHLTPASLQAGFGKPTFTRKDGTVEMWRYDGTACRAFFFFTGTPAVVTHVETLPHARDAAADIGCLNALKSSSPKTS